MEVVGVFLSFLRHNGKEALVEMRNITDMGKQIYMASALTEVYRRIEHQCMATHASLNKVAISKAPWSKQCRVCAPSLRCAVLSMGLVVTCAKEFRFSGTTLDKMLAIGEGV